MSVEDEIADSQARLDKLIAIRNRIYGKNRTDPPIPGDRIAYFGMTEEVTFTMPNGHGGTVDDIEDYWATDTPCQAWQARVLFAEEFRHSSDGSSPTWRREKYQSKVMSHNVRAISAGLVGDLTDGQWSAILESFGYRCAYCDCLPTKLHIEHVVPVSKGGGTTVKNIVPACGPCNCTKHARTPEQWLAPDMFAEFTKRHRGALAGMGEL